MPYFRFPRLEQNVTLNGTRYDAVGNGLIFVPAAAAAEAAKQGGIMDGGAGGVVEWALSAAGTVAGLVGPDGAVVPILATTDLTDTNVSLSVKPAVNAVANSNQTLSGLPTLDGFTLTDGLLALLTAQTAGAENGPWIVHSGSWTRPTWYPSGGTTQAMIRLQVSVINGTQHQGRTFFLNSPGGTITIDTTATVWGAPTSLNANYVAGLASVATSGSASDLGTGTLPAARLTAANIDSALGVYYVGGATMPGDSTTDETTAIQAVIDAAITAATANGVKRTVVFSRGYHRITAGLTVGAATFTSWTRFLGATATITDFTTDLNATNVTANAAKYAIDIDFEDGAYIYADFAPSVATPALGYYLLGYSPATIRNARVIGAAAVTASKYSPAFAASTNKIIGVLSLGAHVRGLLCSAIQFPVFTFSAYWGSVTDVTAYGCGDVATFVGGNATHNGPFHMEYSTRGVVANNCGLAEFHGIHTEQVVEEAKLYGCESCTAFVGYIEDSSVTDGTGKVGVEVKGGHFNTLVGLQVLSVRPNKIAFKFDGSLGNTVIGCRDYSHTVTLANSSSGITMNCGDGLSALNDGSWGVWNAGAINLHANNSISSYNGSTEIMRYYTDGTAQYIRDIVNSRHHAIFAPSSTALGAYTQFGSRVKADGGFEVDEAPANQTARGLIVQLTYGESLVPGDIVYFKSDGKVWKADANAGFIPAMGLALETASSGSHAVLLHGIYRDDSRYNFTLGGTAGTVYLSTTAGVETQTGPSATDDATQILGLALHADRLYFKPDLSYITHT